ncbi:hypothetical protein K501DRAFT_279875 [Backusella circina FSU 941]|nr:hypothetical protein K501DRAFT_279875 [Backusella circina FSU 941]
MIYKIFPFGNENADQKSVCIRSKLWPIVAIMEQKWVCTQPSLIEIFSSISLSNWCIISKCCWYTTSPSSHVLNNTYNILNASNTNTILLRLIKSRVPIQISKPLVNSCQGVFLQGRFDVDNGLLMKMVMEFIIISQILKSLMHFNRLNSSDSQGWYPPSLNVLKRIQTSINSF